jgi:hypothetical protein
MTDLRHTASANLNAPGYVSIKQGVTTVMSFWAWDLMVCFTNKDVEGGTKLVFSKGSMWLPCSCHVDDVMAAVGAATAANTSVYQEHRATVKVA